jgi:hypothetical protein
MCTRNLRSGKKQSHRAIEVLWHLKARTKREGSALGMPTLSKGRKDGHQEVSKCLAHCPIYLALFRFAAGSGGADSDSFWRSGVAILGTGGSGFIRTFNLRTGAGSLATR